MRFMTMQWVLWVALLALACGGETTTETHGHADGDDHEHAEGESHEDGDGDDHEHGDGEEAAALPEQPAVPEGASVAFVTPADGSTVTGPLADGKVTVHVEMGVEGMGVQPAGEGVHEGTGHHHIIVDGDGVAMGETVPADDTHIHFGGGQTEADVALTPGEHTLRLQFADGLHRSYGPSMSTQIAITVAEGEATEAEATEGEAAEAAE